MNVGPDIEDTIPTWVEGQLTPVGKLRAHLEGLKHKAVSVFVQFEDEVLLQKRAKAKYHTPDLWANTCCTHPHWDELAADCATRRLRQELGIEGLTLSHRGQVEYRADVGGGMIEHEVVDIFTARVDERIRAVPNPAEVADTRWINLNDLRTELVRSPGIYTPWLRIYFEEHADLIFGSAC